MKNISRVEFNHVINIMLVTENHSLRSEPKDFFVDWKHATYFINDVMTDSKRGYSFKIEFNQLLAYFKGYGYNPEKGETPTDQMAKWLSWQSQISDIDFKSGCITFNIPTQL